MQQEPSEARAALPRFFTLEMFMFTVAVLSGLVLMWNIVAKDRNVAVLLCAGAIFTLSIVVVIRLLMDPDSVRARQSDAMLKLASQTLACMNDGLNSESAQKICGLLLPSTAAIAVAITDKERILGYAVPRRRRTRRAATSARTPRTPRWPMARCASCSRPRTSAFPKSPRASRPPSSCRCSWGARGRHAQVLLPSREPHQRDAEVHRGGLRPAAVHPDGGRCARRADEAGHQHGAEDAAKPDQPPFPVQHHQHHRSFIRTDPRRRARCCASSRCSIGARSRILRTSSCSRARWSRRNATSRSRWRVSAPIAWRWTWTLILA